MNRRIRTSVLTPNSYGNYVGYVAASESGKYRYHALWIFSGPRKGVWKF